MADPSPALQARVEQEMQTIQRWAVLTDECYRASDVEALVIRLLTEQQRGEAQIQELQARVEPLKAGIDGQDLAQRENKQSPSLPSGRNDR